MGGQGLVEVTKFEADFTLMDTCWVPSSPRLIALGSTLGGQGQIAVLSLSGLVSSLLKICILMNRIWADGGVKRGRLASPALRHFQRLSFFIKSAATFLIGISKNIDPWMLAVGVFAN